MSNSRANMEIMDVLSSIRRLVSEDRSTAPSRTLDPGPDKTDAAPVADADPASSAAEMTADPAQAVATLVSGLAQGVRAARLAPVG